VDWDDGCDEKELADTESTSRTSPKNEQENSGYSDLVAERKVFIVIIVVVIIAFGRRCRCGGSGGQDRGFWVSGGWLGGSCGNGDNCAGNEVSSGRRGDLYGVRSAKNLADVDVGAVPVDLGVVQVEDCRVDSVASSYLLACVIGNNDVCCRTILAGISKADSASRVQIGA